MKAQPVSHAPLEAFEGQTNILTSLIAEEEQAAEPEKPAQIAQTVRRAPEPGRKTPCPCKSGLK